MSNGSDVKQLFTSPPIDEVPIIGKAKKKATPHEKIFEAIYNKAGVIAEKRTGIEFAPSTLQDLVYSLCGEVVNLILLTGDLSTKFIQMHKKIQNLECDLEALRRAVK